MEEWLVGWTDGWTDGWTLCGRQRGAISCSGFLAALPVSQLVGSWVVSFFLFFFLACSEVEEHGVLGDIHSVERIWQAARLSVCLAN